MTYFQLFLIDSGDNYVEIELTDVDFSTTFSVTDLTDLSKRKDSITKNLKILGTKNNNRVLGNLFNLNRSVGAGLTDLNYNYKANKKINAIIYENNVVVMTGEFQILDLNLNGDGEIIYNGVITGNLIKFFSKLNEIELTDLNYPTSTHTYNHTTVANSWTAENLPYIYPTIDYGSSLQSNNVDFRDYRCGLYLKTYFDAIFKMFGYSYTSNFATTDIFKKCFIPYTEKSYSRKINTKLFDYTRPTTFQLSETDTLNTFALNFGTLTSNEYFFARNFTVNGETYNILSFKMDMTTNIKISGVVNANVVSGTNDYLQFDVYTSFYGEPLASQRMYFDNNGDIINADLILNVNPKEFKAAVVGQADAEFSFRVVKSSVAANVSIDVTNMRLEVGTGESTVDIVPNNTISLKQIVPQSIKVYKFLTDIMKVFNLYLTPNPEKRNDFLIEPFDTFYSKTIIAKLNAIDWSDKVVEDEFTNGFNLIIPKNYALSFADDTSNYFLDVYKKKYNENYGDVIINDENGYSEQKKIQINFASTVIASSNQNLKVIPQIWSGDFQKKESYKSPLRLLYNNGTSTTPVYNVYANGLSGTTVATNQTTYNTSSHLLKNGGQDVFNLQFGTPKEVNMPVSQSIFTIDNLYTKFYKNQFLELINPNFSTLDLRMWLTENDIANLDFSTPIFINTQNLGSGYFKLVEVNYKSATELSKVKLQKIIL